MSLTHQTNLIKKFTSNFRRMAGCPEKQEEPKFFEDYYEQQKLLREVAVIDWIIRLVILAVIFLTVWLFTIKAHAEISETVAVNCILGEARGEGYESMLAHAEAIRNRGNVNGVYGCRADFSKEMSYLQHKGIIEQAKKAWQVSQRSKTVKGASFWGSLKVDGKWIAEMERKGFVRTATIKNTAFYKTGAR